MTTWIWIGLGLFIAFELIAIYLLLPVPLLTFVQDKKVTMRGIVTHFTDVHLGLYEMRIEPNQKKGYSVPFHVAYTQTVYLGFFYSKVTKELPNIGDEITVFGIRRWHRFQKRSIVWVTHWHLEND